LIPLPELSKRVNELDANLKIVTVCKMDHGAPRLLRFFIKQALQMFGI